MAGQHLESIPIFCQSGQPRASEGLWLTSACSAETSGLEQVGSEQAGLEQSGLEWTRTRQDEAELAGSGQWKTEQTGPQQGETEQLGLERSMSDSSKAGQISAPEI